MRQADVIVGSGAVLLAVLAAWPGSMEAFKAFTHQSPYISSFLQVAVLTTFGECLALRLKTGRYNSPDFGLACRVLTWGVLGMLIFMCFTIFSSGAQPVLRSLGLAGGVDMHGPFSLAKLPVSFVISATMNCLWAPVMIILHKLSDSHIAATGGSLRRYFATKPDIAGAFAAINWTIMWGFVLKKTIPLFWIPAHTIIFLLPSHLQVLLTALLGVVLGVVLSLAAQSARGGAMHSGVPSQAD